MVIHASGGSWTHNLTLYLLLQQKELSSKLELIGEWSLGSLVVNKNLTLAKDKNIKLSCSTILHYEFQMNFLNQNVIPLDWNGNIVGVNQSVIWN